MSHGGRVFNNSYVSLNLDWNMAQNHFYSRYGTETATEAYLLLGASAGTDVVIGGKTRFTLRVVGSNLTDVAYQPHLSRLKYADVNSATGRRGVFSMGRNVVFKLSIPF